MTGKFTFSEYVPGSRRVRFGAAAVAVGVALLPAAWVLAGTAQAVTPTPVLLGTAGNFAILAGSGITNTGASTILGDVGSSPTSSETGFGACPAANCVTLTGTNHTDPDPNDAATQQAKAALTTAYNNAAGQTPTVKPTELAGQQLVAGVYNSASGTFGMTGTLVLDGENNPDAIFIFQTDSTLITGVTGNVTLIRGAQACNIFWKVGSAATLGTGSTFRGTILAHDTISLGDGVTVDGRLLGGEQASGAGAVTLIHDTITRPTCTTPVTSTTGTATTTSTTGTATTTTGTGGTGGTGTGGSGTGGTSGSGNTGAGTGSTGTGTGTGLVAPAPAPAPAQAPAQGLVAQAQAQAQAPAPVAVRAEPAPTVWEGPAAGSFPWVTRKQVRAEPPTPRMVLW